MTSMAVDGLISGLNTTELISSLMEIEAAPQRLLQSKSAGAAKIVSALQGLNTKVASLASSANELAEPDAFDAHKVTSSSESVTATAGEGALPSSLHLRVDRLSQAQVSMADVGLEAEFGEPPHVTIVRGGKLITIEAATSDLTDLAAAINDSDEAGISATTVRVGTGPEGEPDYRLQLTSTSTGSANSFEAYAGAGTDGARIVDSADAVVPASDAEVTLWPDSGAEVTLTSDTNTFTDVLPGVTFTATAATPDETVRLDVEPDTAPTTSMVSDLVNNVSVVLTDIASRTASSTSTNDEGKEILTGGLLSGNSSIRFLTDQIRSAFTMPVDGRSPSEVGISIDRAGEITLDEDALSEALAADPEGAQAIISGIAQRMADTAETASDPIGGTLTMQITSQEGVVADLDRQISDWDRRLETRRSTLERTYTALEVSLSQLQSQSSWLSSQLANLPGMNSGQGS